MNTINCRIKINDFQDIAGDGVTPAEVILARSIHDNHAGGCCIKNAMPAGKAMTRVGGKLVTKIMQDAEGNEIEVKVDEPKLRYRTDDEELTRLKQKYQVRAKSGAPGTHLCDDLFGGPGTAIRLPQTFAELPAKFKITVIQPQAAPADLDPQEPTPPPGVPESGTAGGDAKPAGPRSELEKKTKDELVAIAESYGIPLKEAAEKKKAELVDAILAKAGYK